MKKIVAITLALIIILISGIALIVLGSLEILNESIFVGVGTGFISSAIVSFFMEIINLETERSLKKRETKLFFHQYRKAFFDFRDSLPYISEKLSCTVEKHNFSTYVEQILNMESYDDLVTQEGMDFRDEIVDEIHVFVEKIKDTVESLLSMEMNILNNEIIYSNFDLIKRQCGNCKRAILSLKNKHFSNAISYVCKMKETHIKLFPTLKTEFEEIYDKGD